MSKQDKSQVKVSEETMVEGNVVTDVVSNEAEKLEKFKQMKREAAERFKERRTKEKVERVENAKAVIDELKNGGFWDKLSEKSKSFITSLTTSTSTGNNQSLFKILFGDNPEVGASITLNDAFTKTLKGKANIDFYVKRWAEKGIVVSFTQDADNILNSVYKLEAFGATVADAE